MPQITKVFDNIFEINVPSIRHFNNGKMDAGARQFAFLQMYQSSKKDNT